MAIDFPNSPTLNEIFSSGTKSWRWNGEKWVFDGRSKKTMFEYTNGITKNVPIIIDDEGHYVAMQPWHTDQPGEWPTEEEALAWGARWIESLNTPASKVQAPRKISN